MINSFYSLGAKTLMLLLPFSFVPNGNNHLSVYPQTIDGLTTVNDEFLCSCSDDAYICCLSSETFTNDTSEGFLLEVQVEDAPSSGVAKQVYVEILNSSSSVIDEFVLSTLSSCETGTKSGISGLYTIGEAYQARAHIRRKLTSMSAWEKCGGYTTVTL